MYIVSELMIWIVALFSILKKSFQVCYGLDLIVKGVFTFFNYIVQRRRSQHARTLSTSEGLSTGRSDHLTHNAGNPGINSRKRV
jgi:hypothetical protein